MSAVLGAAVALGINGLASGSSPAVTVTRIVAAPSPGPSLDTLLLRSSDAPTLNDAAFALIQAGQYLRGLPFAEKAMRLAPAGSTTRGYATFNAGYALLNLGRCGDALTYLRRALAIEPTTSRADIEPRITQAQQCARGGASAPAQSHS